MITQESVHHRWSHRRPVNMEARLFVDGRSPIPAYIENVSIGGVYVDTGDQAVGMDTPVILGFHIPHGDALEYYRLESTVTHVDKHGIGLSFDEYDDSTVEALRQVVHHAIDEERGVA